MATNSEGWSSSDALIQHRGKLPQMRIHEEIVTTSDMIAATSNYTTKYRSERGCRCIVFTTGGSMDLVHLSPGPDEPADKLLVDDLFPNGAISIKLLELPGKGEKLSCDYRIFISNGKGTPPINEFVKQALGCEWKGNIILVPYDMTGQRQRKMKSVQWGASSKQLMTLILKYFVGHFASIEHALTKDMIKDGQTTETNDSE